MKIWNFTKKYTSFRSMQMRFEYKLVNVILSTTICLCMWVYQLALCIGCTFNQVDRQNSNTSCHSPKRLLIHLPALSLSSSHIHTFIMSFSFSECQLILPSLSIQVSRPPSLLLSSTHIQYRSLPPSVHCAVASVVKVMAWQTAL